MFAPIPPREEPDPKQGREAAYALAAQLLGADTPPLAVRQRLTALGLSEAEAARMVTHLQSEIESINSSRRTLSEGIDELEREAVREAGQRNMLYGALWFIGGLLVTAATFSFATGAGGGTYVVAWGAMLGGAIQFFRGLSQSS
ncbi:MAG: hypothetical protein JNM56_21980 [Planctomycetia bacterium]|nr:hypothetical protein [Planctomycetia bacterium]